MIGLVQVGSQAMADRYTYIPLIGLFIALVWTAAELLPLPFRRGEGRGEGSLPKASPPTRNQVTLAAIGLLVLAACAILTRKQVNYWRDDFTLFGNSIAVTTENSVPAHYCLGLAYGKQGKFDLAIPQFRAVLQLVPNTVDAHYHLGLCLMSLGKLGEAAEEYQAALQVNPDQAMARNNLGITFVALGKLEEAAAQFTELARLEPGSPGPLDSLGDVRLRQGKYADAETAFAEAVRCQPQSVPALTGLGRALAAQGKLAEAQAQFREIVRLRPASVEARVNLGNTLFDSGQTNEAAASFAAALRLDPGLAEKKVAEAKALLAKGEAASAFVTCTIAVRLEPANAAAHEALGLIYAQQGRLQEAVREFQQQLQLQPDAQAHYNLALANVMQGQLNEAAANYEEAVKLRPDWPTALNDLAWLRATAPQAGLRDGAEAVRLAERACELSGGTRQDSSLPDKSGVPASPGTPDLSGSSEGARFFGTLAAAYAEAGRFPDAVKAAEKAISLATAAGQKDLADKNRQFLELYRAGRPFHEAGQKQ